MATTLVGEAKKLASVNTAKDVGFTLAGIYLAHIGANMIPFGAKTGWSQVAKLAGSTVVIGWAGEKFLGAEIGRDLFVGGSVLTGLEVVGVVTQGRYGAFPSDQVAAAQPVKQLASPSPAQTFKVASPPIAGQVNNTGQTLAANFDPAGY
ncbi:MAG: hypothetical protein KGL39_12105 [Patescibacteria group bacterium]|nr:hypothetical protein [Patescibacteria group bacterium]